MKTLKVISGARKLVLKVPQTEEVAKFPLDAEISEYSQHLQNNTNPAIVVYNSTDDKWQGADWQTGLVVINSVKENDAKTILRFYDGTLLGLELAIAEAVNLGYTDQYTSYEAFYDKHFSLAGLETGFPYTNFVKRDERDICDVWYDEDGLLRIKVDFVRDITPEKLLETYVNLDGTQINLASIPTNYAH